jgi:hypothetical protein
MMKHKLMAAHGLLLCVLPSLTYRTIISSIKMRLYQIAALIVTAQAALRFACSTLSIQRLDPLVEPGKLPSAHVHQIVGGNAFNATMDKDPGEVASCTTCTFTEDFR